MPRSQKRKASPKRRRIRTIQVDGGDVLRTTLFGNFVLAWPGDDDIAVGLETQLSTLLRAIDAPLETRVDTKGDGIYASPTPLQREAAIRAKFRTVVRLFFPALADTLEVILESSAIVAERDAKNVRS